MPAKLLWTRKSSTAPVNLCGFVKMRLRLQVRIEAHILCIGSRKETIFHVGHQSYVRNIESRIEVCITPAIAAWRHRGIAAHGRLPVRRAPKVDQSARIRDRQR